MREAMMAIILAFWMYSLSFQIGNIEKRIGNIEAGMKYVVSTGMATASMLNSERCK
jgi:hypothetical protein